VPHAVKAEAIVFAVDDSASLIVRGTRAAPLPDSFWVEMFDVSTSKPNLPGSIALVQIPITDSLQRDANC
jgi:hypothetical protein